MYPAPIPYSILATNCAGRLFRSECLLPLRNATRRDAHVSCRTQQCRDFKRAISKLTGCACGGDFRSGRYGLRKAPGILDKEAPEEDSSMALLGQQKEKEVPPLPPRYRLRDLIMGDYAFNDDGER